MKVSVPSLIKVIRITAIFQRVSKRRNALLLLNMNSPQKKLFSKRFTHSLRALTALFRAAFPLSLSITHTHTHTHIYSTQKPKAPARPIAKGQNARKRKVLSCVTTPHTRIHTYIIQPRIPTCILFTYSIRCARKGARRAILLRALSPYQFRGTSVGRATRGQRSKEVAIRNGPPSVPALRIYLQQRACSAQVGDCSRRGNNARKRERARALIVSSP